MNTYLKVKIKSLAAEAVIIRKEERKAKTSRAYRRDAKRRLQHGIEVSAALKGGTPGFRDLTNSERELATKQAQPPSTEALDLFFGLQWHRKDEVRSEARSAQLAYGFLRGRTYRQLEQFDKKRNDGRLANSPNLIRVAEIVKKFGGRGLTQACAEKEVKAWIEA